MASAAFFGWHAHSIGDASSIVGFVKNVSREHFRRVYLEHGGGYGVAGNKHALAAWDDRYEKPGWTYALEEPESAEHTRMTTVTDNGAKEYRLFFMTEAAEDAFYDYPGKE